MEVKQLVKLKREQQFYDPLRNPTIPPDQQVIVEPPPLDAGMPRAVANITPEEMDAIDLLCYAGPERKG